MSKIVEQASHHSVPMSNIITNVHLFEKNDIKAIVTIFDEFIKLEADPNPLSAALSSIEIDLASDLLERLEGETTESNYSQIIKICTIQPELHRCFLRKEVLK
jgi:hypothetical protein